MAILDIKIQKRQIIKFTLFSLIIVFIVWNVGFKSSSKTQTNQSLVDVIGGASMTDSELASVKSAKGVLNIKQWETSNGARVYFVEAPNLPMLDINMIFDAGSARDEKKSGVAFLTSEVLSSGTKDLNADAIAEAFEEVGAEFNVSSHRDSAVIRLRSLTKTDLLSSALNTLSQLLKAPAFAKDDFKREQSQLLTLLKYESQRPDKIAQKEFYKALYQDHPYGNWPHGAENSVSALTPGDLKDFYAKYFVAKNMVVTLVGAININEASAIAEKLAASLEEGEKPDPLPKVNKLKESVVINIDFPSEQTHIMVGQPALSRDDCDYFPLIVGNHILGGNSTVTRIFNEIRHKRGLAYDAHSYFIPMRVDGPFIAGLQTKGEQRTKALDILTETIKQFIKEGPTDQELTDAQLNIIGGFPLFFDNNKAIAQQVAMIGHYDLPLDYFDNYKESIQNVTKENILRSFKERIHPESMVVVMVGKNKAE